jgi:hypothetical protein
MKGKPKVRVAGVWLDEEGLLARVGLWRGLRLAAEDKRSAKVAEALWRAHKRGLARLRKRKRELAKERRGEQSRMKDRLKRMREAGLWAMADY